MFKLVSNFNPSGDQPEAIAALEAGLRNHQPNQTLLGVTGSGKTFTLANVISAVNRPALILSHNKTLAAQLYSEFKSFFPENAVEYFISYYDYYLPEAYIPQTDTYIAKDASINENIERLRLASTASLLSRKDVIVVASVSCIYSLGSPEEYANMCIPLCKGQNMKRDELLRRLVKIQFVRNDLAPERGQFRVRGDSVDVFVPEKEQFIRIEFWGDEIEEISVRNVTTGNFIQQLTHTALYPCRHFVMAEEKISDAVSKILKERDDRVRYFESQGLLVEAQRLYQRTTYDVEMIKEIGYCSGIENYSVYLSDRKTRSRPFCLLDFFPKNYITIIDESHVTIPQIRAMYKADRSRKQTLVEHGFRLPSALDNRPLTFEEFNSLSSETIYVSATPGDYEIQLSSKPVEQVVRPTGLLDPEVMVRPLKGQVDDVIGEIRNHAQRNERTIVTTLTKKNAERLADYLSDLNLRVKYLHSGIDALERVRIIGELRQGGFDCLIGINLLREGIDLPEVALVAILDADKEGFLRSSRALIQVAGRAARNINGKVILYADKRTDSIKSLLEATKLRRSRQIQYNKSHGITPKTVYKSIKESICDIIVDQAAEPDLSYNSNDRNKSNIDLIQELKKEMLAAAHALEFERAASLRDRIKSIQKSQEQEG